MYVVDIIFGVIDESLYNKLPSILQEFEMSLMGELTYFQGLKINQAKDRKFIIKTKYCFELLKKFDKKNK